MRKAAVVLGLAAALVPAGVSAQGNVGTVTATAQIAQSLNAFLESDLDFATVDPITGASVLPGSAPATGTLGALRVETNADFSVGVVISPLQLGAETISADYQCGYSTVSSTGALTGAGQFACNAAPNPGLGASSTVDPIWLQVGGSIAPAEVAGKTPGTYTGSLVFTFTATL